MILTGARIAAGCDELMNVMAGFHGVAGPFDGFAALVSRKSAFVIAL
jgi:hypothetical protein